MTRDETLFFDYQRQHKLKIKVARIFNTYGPNMCPNDGRVVSSFIVQSLQGVPTTIYGSQGRSFCYVDNLVDGLIRLMNFDDDCTGPINLGNPNTTLAREILGWEPQIELEKGLQKAIPYFRGML